MTLLLDFLCSTFRVLTLISIDEGILFENFKFIFHDIYRDFDPCEKFWG